MAVATAGVSSMCETVATTTQSTSAASMPACSIAARAAETDIIWMVSSGPANRRSRMPERCWIHSSLESMASISSAFGTTRVGRYEPTPRIAACGLPGALAMLVMR